MVLPCSVVDFADMLFTLFRQRDIDLPAVPGRPAPPDQFLPLQTAHDIGDPAGSDPKMICQFTGGCSPSEL